MSQLATRSVGYPCSAGRLRSEQKELDALMPSVLAKAFSGEL